jgi:palmitoyltransferase ZDHHC9/14/18
MKVQTTDPGIIPRGYQLPHGHPLLSPPKELERKRKDNNFINLNNENYNEECSDAKSSIHYQKFCKVCKIWRPTLSTHHCYDCNNCVLGHDHHCILMGCCIGLIFI